MGKKAARVKMPKVRLRRRRSGPPTPQKAGLRRVERGALHRQLKEALRRRIVSGAIAPGSRLPSSRALAARLRISRNVVLQAYEELAAQGYVTGRVGSGTRVARARRDTYLWEVVKQGPTGTNAGRRVSLKKRVEEAKYPETAARFVGVEGLVHYLYGAKEDSVR